MPIQFGFSSSHAPALFQDTLEGWNSLTRARPGGGPSGPPPLEAALETREEVEQRRAPRSKRNFETLRQQLSEYNPDTLIMVGGDQGEWFDASNMPSILIYAGEEDLWGTHTVGARDEGVNPPDHHDRFKIDFKVDKDLAHRLLEGLVQEGFDVAISTKMAPASQPKRGLPHAFANPAPWIMNRPDLPIVPVFIMTTEQTPAILTGERCVALGRAIAKVCEDSPKRIAIYGSGGLSHPSRRGWVDEPMDNWFLDRLSSGDVESLKSMFSFQSVNTLAGNGEDRTWIVTAGAIDYMKPGHKGVTVDYFPARMGITGVGWLYYPPIQEHEPVH